MEGDEEENLRASSDVNGEWNNVIFHGSTDDQTNYVPLGSGMLVMTVLGGLFLMNKRKNESK